MSDQQEPINPFKMPKYVPPEESQATDTSATPPKLEAIDDVIAQSVGDEINKPIEFIPGDGDETGKQIAIAILAAEESARITTEGFAKMAFELRRSYSPTVVSAEGTTSEAAGAPKTVWSTSSIQQKDWTVNGSYKVLEMIGISGVVVDFIVISSSSDFKVTVSIDGVDLYNDDYSTLADLTRSDTNLSAYQNQTSGNYTVALHNLYWAYEVTLVVGASNVTFDQIRVNYNAEMTA